MIKDSMPRGWKKAATARCQAITAEAADGQPITGDDAEWLSELITRHPCADEKIGPGIAWFTAGVVLPFKTRGLFVHRVDGTVTDFSWRTCITAPDHSSMVRAAMRRAVELQVTEFKAASARNGGLYDAVTGEPLTWDNVHVDHAPPVFIIIANAYASLFGGYEAIPLTPSRDGQIGRALDGEHQQKWAGWHAFFARLRIVSVATNLSLLRIQQSGA
jgi:hypothetical protein